MKLISGVCALVFLIMLGAIVVADFSISSLLTALLFLAGSIGALVLRETYTTLLLKLQPDDTNYTFYL